MVSPCADLGANVAQSRGTHEVVLQLVRNGSVVSETGAILVEIPAGAAGQPQHVTFVVNR